MSAARAVAARLVVACVAFAVTPAGAQSLGSRVAGVRDGTVRMTFAARPGVCGAENGGVSFRRGDETMGVTSGRRCTTGPLVVTIGRADSQTASVRVRVATSPGDRPGRADIGEVSPLEAFAYLTDLAHHLSGRNASDAVTAAALARDVDVSPGFQTLVRDASASLTAREQALFWLGESDAPTADIIGLYDGLAPFALREHFAFVLSQRHDDQALDKLIDVASHDRDLEIRRRAMFWLGQSNDPRAVKFFREVLSR